MKASPRNPEIRLKNPVAAAILAFLVPGAGHFYQGRLFKAIIYFVCILTLFIWGMQMGHWKILYRLQPSSIYEEMMEHQDDLLRDPQFEELRQYLEPQPPSRRYAKTHWGYFAQLPVGMFSVPAFIQEERYYSNNNTPSLPESLQIERPIEAELLYSDDEGHDRKLLLSGVLELAPEQTDFGPEVKGAFRGQSDDGKDVVVQLNGQAVLDAPIGSAPYRQLGVSALKLNGEELDDGMLVARTHRSLFNSFLVPPDYPHLEALHSELGKKFTLAEVFTWIAGLLNVLAIWDAFAGPAYGYRLPVRSEGEAEKEKKSSGDSESEKESETAPASSATA
jgi:hypothetical protein